MTLSREDFAVLLETHPALAGKILYRVAQHISRRLRQHIATAPSITTQYLSGKSRVEHDFLGELGVPDECYYGIQTLRQDFQR